MLAYLATGLSLALAYQFPCPPEAGDLARCKIDRGKWGWTCTEARLSPPPCGSAMADGSAVLAAAGGRVEDDETTTAATESEEVSVERFEDGSFRCSPTSEPPWPGVLYNHGGLGSVVGGDLQGTCLALAEAGYLAYSKQRPLTDKLAGHIDEVKDGIACRISAESTISDRTRCITHLMYAPGPHSCGVLCAFLDRTRSPSRPAWTRRGLRSWAFRVAACSRCRPRCGGRSSFARPS